MQISYIGHATVGIELDGVRLLTDPILRGRVAHLRRYGTVGPEWLSGLDAVLISHAHGDHLDPTSLRLLDGGPRCVVPAGLRAFERRRGLERVEELAVGDSTTVGPLTVTAVAADHDGRRTPFSSVRGIAVGYVIRGSRSVYFAGDTGLCDDMRVLAEGEVDLALVPVAGWGPTLGPGHMDPFEAAESLQLVRPRIAIPIHWGTLSPIGSKPPTREPAEQFAEAAAELAPDVRCIILDPGESVSL